MYLEATAFSSNAFVIKLNCSGAVLQKSFKPSISFDEVLINFARETLILVECSELEFSSGVIDLLAVVFLLRTFKTVAIAGKT